jgi:hypothetical protein
MASILVKKANTQKNINGTDIPNDNPQLKANAPGNGTGNGTGKVTSNGTGNGGAKGSGNGGAKGSGNGGAKGSGNGGANGAGNGIGKTNGSGNGIGNGNKSQKKITLPNVYKTNKPVASQVVQPEPGKIEEKEDLEIEETDKVDENEDEAKMSEPERRLSQVIKNLKTNQAPVNVIEEKQIEDEDEEVEESIAKIVEDVKSQRQAITPPSKVNEAGGPVQEAAKSQKGPSEIGVDVEKSKVCPPCKKEVIIAFPIPFVERRVNIVNEEEIFDQFTDHQLNRIGFDRNIPDIMIYPRKRKIELLLSDPNRDELDRNSSLDDLDVGDLLYIAGMEKIPVHLISDRYNTRRVLVALIMYQRKRSDLVSTNILTDDDLRTIIQVIEVCKDIKYSWIVCRKDLENIYYTGTFPKYNENFLTRWRRYEGLRILPHQFLQSLSFQLDSSVLTMTPNENYIIARLIDLPENPFETIHSKDRRMDVECLKYKYGIVVPMTWDSMDYVGLNGSDYPFKKTTSPFLIEKLLSMGSNEQRRKYLELYNDVELFVEIKNYVPYQSRRELIDNILTLFDESEQIYFVSLLPNCENKIYYGNYLQSEVFDIDRLVKKLDFLTTQNYPLSDKVIILKKMRQLQNLLLSRNMMTPKIANSLSRLICTYEGIPDAHIYFCQFLLLAPEQIALIRKHFYQKFYYTQTRNSLYLPIIPSDFVKGLPRLCNVNVPNPSNKIEQYAQDSLDDLYQTIAYMKLFFGYVPHSIKNL